MAEHGLSEEQIAAIKHAFAIYDRGGEGVILTREIGTLMKSLGYNVPKDELVDIMNEVDFEVIIINLVALCMMKTNNTKNKPAGTSPGLPRSSFAARNTVAFDLCVPRNILRDTPDLTYVQPEGKGTIGIQEFMSVMVNRSKEEAFSKKLIDAFRVFDVRGKGVVDTEVARHIFSSMEEEMPDEEIDELLKEAKIDKDGNIKYEDFVRQIVR